MLFLLLFFCLPGLSTKPSGHDLTASPALALLCLLEDHHCHCDWDERESLSSVSAFLHWPAGMNKHLPQADWHLNFSLWESKVFSFMMFHLPVGGTVSVATRVLSSKWRYPQGFWLFFSPYEPYKFLLVSQEGLGYFSVAVPYRMTERNQGALYLLTPSFSRTICWRYCPFPKKIFLAPQ